MTKKNWPILISKNVLLISILALTFFVYELAIRAPIFTDEVSYKILFSRYFLDNHISITELPQCRSEFTYTRPKIFFVFWYLESLIYGDLTNLLKIRVGSILYLAICFYLLFLITDLSIRDTPNWTKVKSWIWVLCLYSLGISPFFMILNRPEMPILIFLLSITLILIISSLQEHRDLSWLIWTKFVYFICVVGMYFYHPKTLFFTPLLLLVGWVAFHKPIYKIGTIFFSIYVATQAFIFTKYRTECPLDLQLNKRLKEDVICQIDAIYHLQATFLRLIKNLLATSSGIRDIGFSGGHTWSYFPNLGSNGLIQNPVTATLFKVWNYSFYLFMIFLLCQIIRSLIFSLRSICLKFNFEVQKTFFTVLVFTLITLSAFTNRKVFYNNTLILPVFFLCATLAIKQLPKKSKNWTVKLLFRMIVMLFISSSILFLSSYSKFRNDFQKGGEIHGIPFGVSGFKSDVINSRVQKLALKCGIDSKTPLKHLVVDELSYPSFWKTEQPYLALFMFWVETDAKENGIENFLKSRKSSGFIGVCRYLPPQLQMKAQKDQEFCCLPAFN